MYVRMDGRTDGANRRTDGRDGVREPRARDRTGTNKMRENPGTINWTSGYDDNRGFFGFSTVNYEVKNRPNPSLPLSRTLYRNNMLFPHVTR